MHGSNSLTGAGAAHHPERAQGRIAYISQWKEAIARCFDAAADTYDGGADSQRQIALALRQQVLRHLPSPALKVLEIGCGTGFLTSALQPDLPDCRWIATDVAPRMLQICRQRVGEGAVTFDRMDGEYPDLAERNFDLIVSNLAAQWFVEPAAGLRRLHALLRPGGLLAVTTLGSGTFRQWRDACIDAGVEPATPPYPEPSHLRRMLGADVEILQQAWPLTCANIHGFLEHLKLTGARVAAPGHAPQSPAVLNRILRAGAGRPFTVTYDVLTVLWRKRS